MVPVFRAGAVQRRRPGFTVDEHHIVALAVPVVRITLKAVEVQIRAAVYAIAFDVSHNKVFRIAQILPARVITVCL